MGIINATLINLYRVCPRECWLHANGIRMEHNSDLVKDGRILEETSYLQRSPRYTQLELSYNWSGILLTGKIDFIDTKTKVIHETKRSNEVESAHIWQVKFYLWLLTLNKIEVRNGLLEYPKPRQRQIVEWEDGDQEMIEGWVKEVKRILSQKECPPLLHARICRSCSYFDFCYADEPKEELPL